jgi:hypothetical protein
MNATLPRAGKTRFDQGFMASERARIPVYSLPERKSSASVAALSYEALDMRRIGLLVCSIGLVLAGSQASTAAEISRQDFQGAVGMCKASTPAYAASVRNRPLGMANESTADIYVTCNWQGDDSQNGTRGARRVFVVVGNTSASAKTVACTLVNGFQSGTQTNATYTPKTATVAAGGGTTIAWVPGDIAGAPDQIKLPALSCKLPGGTTLQHTGKQYNEDVGA